MKTKRMTEAELKKHIEAILMITRLIEFLENDRIEKAAKLDEIHAAEENGLIDKDMAIELAVEFC